MLLIQKAQIIRETNPTIDGQSKPDITTATTIDCRFAMGENGVKYGNGEVKECQAVMHSDPRQLYLTQGMLIKQDQEFYTIIKSETTINLAGEPILQYSYLQIQPYED